MTVQDSRPRPVDPPVDPADLICPGCFESVVAVPAEGWPASAGQVPEFSHWHGSVLCLDGVGRISEPVEASQVRLWPTEQTYRVLGSERDGGRS